MNCGGARVGKACAWGCHPAKPAPDQSLLTQRLEQARHYIGWARWRLGLSEPSPSAVMAEDHVARIEQEIKAARGSAAASMKKSLAQGLKLVALQAAHVRTKAQLRLVNEERDELKKILEECAPAIHAHWLRAKWLMAHRVAN